jgi:enoyl-CoA hydratase/carnithine racemase
MLLLGTPVDAARALEWGLVNRVVEPAALAGAVDEVLAALLAGAPGAVRAQKALMIRWRESDLPSAVRAGIDAFAASYATDEPREGAAAFLEKRPPRFGARP